MNDQDLQALLRRYQPVGPPPGLRARVFAGRSGPRAWPWLSAAAALLAATLGLHLASRAEAGRVYPRLCRIPIVRSWTTWRSG